MRGIAKLLFGDDADRVIGLFGDGDGDGDGFGMADRARRAGEWCGSTPGSTRGAGPAATPARPRGMRREVIIREFRDR
jgi:hypothetical protein